MKHKFKICGQPRKRAQTDRQTERFESERGFFPPPEVRLAEGAEHEVQWAWVGGRMVRFDGKRWGP